MHIPRSDVTVARYLEVNAENGLADDDIGAEAWREFISDVD